MKVFRPGATLLPLFIWTIAVGVAALFLERHALLLERGTTERWIFQLIVTSCVILGPVAFLAHLARRLLVHVSIGDDGLHLSRGRIIPWTAIDSVEHREGPFRGGRSLKDSDMFAGVGEGCLWAPYSGEGCLIGLAVLAALGLLTFVFLPVFSLFSPWHARVILNLKNGDRLVFRDLDDDHEFVAQLRVKRRA